MERNRNSAYPPGRVKIVDAVTSLLSEKDFNSITTAEIARTAGVTEGLIYKYFKDKRDLLYQVLREYYDSYLARLERDLAAVEGPLERLRFIIHSTLAIYDSNRVFARILLLEVRNSTDFFQSEAYVLVKRFANEFILDTLVDGVREGEIRSDLDAGTMRLAVMGALEHACLAGIIFNREIDPSVITEKICTILFGGIAARESR